MPDRVSTLELFFDLIFVFTVTQVARLVSGAHGAGDLGAAALILTVAWWMYGGYAWLTNNIGTAGLALRLLMLVGMAAYFVMALAIPRAGGDDGFVFGIAFTLVTIVHTVLFMQAPNSSARAILGIAPYNLAAAACGRARFDPPIRWIGWAAAIAIFGGHRASKRGFQVSVSRRTSRARHHRRDRRVDRTRRRHRQALRWPLIHIVALGFALCAAIWWTY
jgi:low temperature requirement protein LtrA